MTATEPNFSNSQISDIIELGTERQRLYSQICELEEVTTFGEMVEELKERGYGKKEIVSKIKEVKRKNNNYEKGLDINQNNRYVRIAS